MMQEDITTSNDNEKWNAPIKRRRKAVSSALLAYVRIALTIVKGIIFVPLYLHFIEKEMYGLWLATGGIVAWMIMFDLGISGLIGQKVAFYFGKKDRLKVGEYYLNGTIIHVIIAISIFIIALLIATHLAIILKISIQPYQIKILQNCFLLSTLTFCMTMIDNGQRGFSNGMQYVLFPNIIAIASNVVGVVLILILLYKGAGVYAIAIGGTSVALLQIISNFSFSFYLFNSYNLKAKISFKIIKEYARIMPFTLFSGIGNAVSGRIEPLLITMYLNSELAVNYTITKRAGDIMQLVVNVLNTAIFPGFAHAYGENGKVKEIFKEIFMIIIVLLITLFTLYLSFNKLFIKLWVGIDNFSGMHITVLIGIGVILIIINNLLSRILVAMGFFTKNALINGITAIGTLPLMLICLKFFGIVGLPLAILIGKGTSVLIYSVILIKKLKFTSSELMYGMRKIVIISIVTIILINFCIKLNTDSWLGFMAYVLMLIVSLFSFYSIIFPQLRKNTMVFLKKMKTISSKKILTHK